MAKTNNQAVLFLSKLDVVEEMRMWFIAPDGKLTSVGSPLHKWEEVLKDLRVVFSEVLIGETQTSMPPTQAAQLNSEGKQKWQVQLARCPLQLS